MSEDIYIQIANDGTVTMTTTEWASLTGSAANGFVLKLYNNAGVVFPATGASDRTWVYLGAVLIMVATAALFIKRKNIPLLIKGRSAYAGRFFQLTRYIYINKGK